MSSSKYGNESVSIIIGALTEIAAPQMKGPGLSLVFVEGHAPPAFEIDRIGEDNHGFPANVAEDFGDLRVSLIVDPGVDRIRGVARIALEIETFHRCVIIITVQLQKVRIDRKARLRPQRVCNFHLRLGVGFFDHVEQQPTVAVDGFVSERFGAKRLRD